MRSSVFIILFLSSFLVRAQAISGIIVNEENEPLVGATVYAYQLKKGTITNDLGAFELEGLQGKVIAIQISSLGYESKIITFNIPTENIKIELHESILEMEEVVVSGGFVNTQDRSAVKISSIGLEQLKKSAAPSLIQALTKEAGVEMVKMGQGVLKPVIRGLTGTRVATLFRGTRIESQAWGEEHGIFIPEQGLERVEVIKGPASLLYGSDAMGGVLNFIPQKPLLNTGRKSNIYLVGYSNSKGYNGSFQTQKRSEKSYHAFNGGHHSHADYRLPNGEEADNSRYNQFYAQGIWGLSKNWGLIEGAYSSSYNNAGLMRHKHAEEEHEEQLEGRAMESPWQQSGDHIITTDATFWSGNWTFKPMVSYQLNHRKEFEEHEEEPTSIEEHAALDMSLRTSQFDFKAYKQGEKTEWILGTKSMHQTNTNEGEEQLIPDATTQDAALFTQLNWKQNNWQWQGGARADMRKIQVLDVLDNTYLNSSFSIGATYHLGEHMVLRANTAQGFRAPNLFELTAEGVHHGAIRYERGNSSLKSEKNLEFDLSAHWHSKHVVVDFAIFQNNIRDYIYSSGTDSMIDNLHVYEHLQDDAKLRGAEIGFDWHPHPWHWLHITTTAAYVEATNLQTGSPLPMIPPLKWNAELSAEQTEWNGLSNVYLSVESEYAFGQEQVAPEEEMSEAYHLLHLSVGTSLSQRFSLGLSINNLLNTEYIPHLSLLKEAYIYEPGRNIVTKLSYNF